jgi:hypothetical protein
MIRISPENLFKIISISLWMFIFPGPVYANEFDGLFSIFFALFVYPPILVLSLVFHIICISRGVYRKRNNLIISLIVINLLALIGVFPASIFMESSVLAIMGFICFWGVLVAIPMHQYWHREKQFRVSATWRDGVTWMLCGTILFYFIMAVFLIKPIVRQYRTERHNARIIQDRILWEKQNEKRKKEVQAHQQKLSENRQKHILRMELRHKQFADKQQEEYARLLKTILNHDQAEVVKLKTMTGSQVKQQMASGLSLRGVDGYFVDRSKMMESQALDNLKTLLHDPSLYNFEYQGMFDPFFRDSQRAYAVFFRDGQGSPRIMFYLDQKQITLVYSDTVKAVKLNDISQIEQFFSET